MKPERGDVQRNARRARMSSVALALLTWLAWAALANAQAATEMRKPAARKEESAEYRSLMDRGLAAYGQQRFAEARAFFARGHALAPSARTQRALGIADLALDNFTLAREELQAALDNRSSPLTADQRGEVAELLAWMRANLGTLHLRCTPVHAEAMIDGRPVKLPEVLLEPNEHRLLVTANGFVPREQTFTLRLEQPLTLEVALVRESEVARASAAGNPRVAPGAPVNAGSPAARADTLRPEAAQLPTPGPAAPPAAPSGGPKLWPWIGGGGAVLLIAGGALLLAGLSDKSTVENARRGSTLADLEPAHDRVPWLTGGGIALGAVGIAGIGTAAVLLFSERERRSDVAWSVEPGLTGLSIGRGF
jgi:hypothetical protein